MRVASVSNDNLLVDAKRSLSMPSQSTLKSRSTRSHNKGGSKLGHSASRRVQGIKDGAGVSGSRTGVSGSHGGPSRSSGGTSAGGVRVLEQGMDVTPKPLLSRSGGGLRFGGGLGAPAPAAAAAAAAAAAVLNDEHPPGEQLGLAPLVADGAVDDPEVDVTLTLTETPTLTLLHIDSHCVAQDDAKRHAAVTARNKAYEELIEAKATSDKYHERPAQTLNPSQKTKDVTATPATTQDAGCDASSWDIYDKMDEQRAQEEEAGLSALTGGAGSADDEGKGEEGAASKGGGDGAAAAAGAAGADMTGQVSAAVTAAAGAPGCLLDVAAGKQPARPTADGEPAPAAAAVTAAAAAAAALPAAVCTASMVRALRVTERAVQQNSYHGQHLRYRDFPMPSSVVSAGMGVGGGALGSGMMGGGAAGGGAAGGGAAGGGESGAAPAEAAPAAAAEEGASGAGVAAAGTDGAQEDGADADAGAGADGSEAAAASANAANANAHATGAILGGFGGAAGRGLESLWAFECPLTVGRNVSAMSWNKADPDLLAVAYGEHDFRGQRDGLVLFWSLKNPQHPERVYRAPVGVTALDFSRAHPSLLAVGLYDGSVTIYDIRKDDAGPVLESAQGEGKHMDPVWQLQWTRREGAGGGDAGEEVLVSVSTDGAVTQWSITKSLAHSTLMALKRAAGGGPSKGGKGKAAAVAGGGIISRQASGFCVDFPAAALASAADPTLGGVPLGGAGTEDEAAADGADGSMYLAGTEEGVIHKCSCSYNEQYVETFYGHTGPVYRIRSSPFLGQAFLSCSADWTVKLWSQRRPAAISSFNSTAGDDMVHDIAWSPLDATVFSAVTADGRVEVWDVQGSTLDPAVSLRRAPLPAPAPRAAGGAAAPGIAAAPPVPPLGADSIAAYDDLGGAGAATEPAAEMRVPILTNVLFGSTGRVLVVGDSVGAVTVYRLHGVGAGPADVPLSDAEQAEKLRGIMFPDES
eukprot:g1572.t1